MTTPADIPMRSESNPCNKASDSSENSLPTKILPTLPADAAPPLPNFFAPPRLLGYELLRELGRGGMGVVYEAFDQKRQRKVALKTMQGIDPRALLRFKQEFRSLAGLNHFNLVSLYELIGDGTHWFFTMEIIEGVSFLRFVRNDDTRRSRLRESLRQLVRGVHFLHENGKLHRDIKPSNVLVTEQGRVVLLDFGLTAEMDRDRLHHSANLLGTVAYMAPEQAGRRALSPASDWYAVGVMLYEALTAKLPFDGDNHEILYVKQCQDPPPPTSWDAHIPPDLAELCMDLLRRDPHARAKGEDILSRLASVEEPELQTAPPLPSSGQHVEVPLIGRQQHLQILTESLLQMRQGRTVVVELHGRSGAGKSALVHRFLDDLAGSARQVEPNRPAILMGRCYEQEAMPYKALDSLIDALSRYLEHLTPGEVQALCPRDLTALARVFPVLQRLVEAAPRRALPLSDPQELRRRALNALRELLSRLGDRRPLILSIDDLQWGDEDSAALLIDLLRPPDPPVLLLLLSYRSEDADISPCLRALRQIQELPGLERLTLPVEPLTLEERRELALALLDARDETASAHAESIARQSGGYPFFVYELARYLQGGKSSPAPSSRGSADLSLSEVLWSRIVSMPEEARRLLEIVAVASRPIAQADACRAAQVEDEPGVFSCLRAGRLIRVSGVGDGGEIETYHDRIREAVLLHLEPFALRQHHRSLAAVLESSEQSDPEVLAIHLFGANESQRAGHYYALAAERAAATLAFDRAAKLYRLALELRSPCGDDERQLRTKLGDALANAGRGAESARAYLGATTGSVSSENLELQRRAALHFLRAGHIDDGLSVLQTVLAATHMKMLASPRRVLVGLLCQRVRLLLRGLRFHLRSDEQIDKHDLERLEIFQSAAIGLSMVDTLQGAYFQTLSTLLALRLGEPQRLVTALAMHAAHLSVSGQGVRGRTDRCLRVAEGIAGQFNQPYPRAMVSLARGIVAALSGHWREGLRLCDEAESIFRDSCTGAVWELGTAHRFALWPLMFMGEIVEINRRLPRLLKEARERDDLYEETNLCLVVRTFARLAGDEPELARVELDQVMERWSHQGFHVQHMNRLIDETQIDLYVGESARAWQRLADAWPTLRRSHLLHIQQVRIVLLDLRARCALARAVDTSVSSWLRLAQRDARSLRREKAPWSIGLAYLLEAGIVFQRGDAKQAVARLESALAIFESAEMHLYAAIARCRLGQLLGGPLGERYIRQAEDWMNMQSIRNRERMTALLAPSGRGRCATGSMSK
jgi:serine/threonine protein kinase/tetratricopeptide (TPR) repeat protein